MSETTPRQNGQQAGRSIAAADLITAARLPLAVLFIVVHAPAARIGILVVAALSDLLDGYLARHLGSSRFGAFLDPVVDKLFMAAAFGVVAFSGVLSWYEILGALLRDVWATAAFLGTLIFRRPTAIPARYGGKAVTVGQVLTLMAFLTESPLVRPLAWATAAIALYAIWDYQRVAGREGRPLQ